MPGDGRKAILLLAFGGPDSLEAVPSFMESLIGRKPPAPLLEAVVERYRLVGGRSPLPEMTRAQARALADYLAARGEALPVYVGMRYAEPSVEKALVQMASDGVTDAVALSLAPYRSQVSTGAYEQEVAQALPRVVNAPRIRFARDWYGHPGFIDALAEKLEEGLSRFPAERRREVPVIFSAHSLPVEYVAQGDPYVDHLRATVEAILAKVGPLNRHFGYQSKGAGHGEWLGPQVEEVLDGLAAAGHREVLVDPIGFVSDHMETLYDNDVLHREHAEKLDMRFQRCACLNTSPRFIAALADIALTA